LVQVHLDAIDKSLDSAAYMLSKFITRPDVKKLHLPEFVDWCLRRVKTVERM